MPTQSNIKSYNNSGKRIAIVTFGWPWPPYRRTMASLAEALVGVD